MRRLGLDCLSIASLVSVWLLLLWPLFGVAQLNVVLTSLILMVWLASSMNGSLRQAATAVEIAPLVARIKPQFQKGDKVPARHAIHARRPLIDLPFS